MTTQDHRQFSSDSSLQRQQKKRTRRDLTDNNCHVSPDRVVHRRTHECPSAYDHSTQCWVYPQCSRTRTHCLSNQQTHSPSYHEIAPGTQHEKSRFPTWSATRERTKFPTWSTPTERAAYFPRVRCTTRDKRMPAN